ncbi:MAG TPA: MFS transporter [Burkholderiaceae bacterium]|nr:MFS transporter [Burkholderiaceae bacterium]
MKLLRIIAILALAHTVFTGARVSASLYALAHQASTFTVGVVIALFSLVPALIAVRAGRWLDRVGARAPLLAGGTLLAAGALLPALFPYAVADIAPLLVGVVMVGTGSMLTQITVQDWVGRQAAPAERTAAFSWVAMGASVSGLIGPVASGFLIDAAGHRATFAGLGTIALAMLALLAAQWQRLPAADGMQRHGEARPFFDLLRHPPVRNVLIVTTLISMSWDLQSFMVPVLGTRVGLSASQIGLILGSFSVATLAIRSAMPWLSRTWRPWQVLTFTLFTAALAFAVMPLFSSMLPLMACAALLGLGLGAAQPNVMSLLHERTPAGRVGEALGLRTTIMNGSHIVLPLVFGAAGAVAGAAAVFWIMAALLSGVGFAARRPHFGERLT